MAGGWLVYLVFLSIRLKWFPMLSTLLYPSPLLAYGPSFDVRLYLNRPLFTDSSVIPCICNTTYSQNVAFFVLSAEAKKLKVISLIRHTL